MCLSRKAATPIPSAVIADQTFNLTSRRMDSALPSNVS